jgi:DNA-binding response OmpR family regulator
VDNARIGIFEADPQMTKLYDAYLSRRGHKVVLSAESAPDPNLIQDFKKRGGELDVALVDLHASPQSTEESQTARVAELIRKNFKQTIIVTVHSVEEPPKEADLAIDKTDLRGFVEYVDNLPKPQY